MKRIYNILFEERPITDIQDDYYEHKWISKYELEKLFEYEKVQLINIYKEKEQEFHDLLKGFNLNAYSNYDALEKKFQGSLKKKDKT